MAPKAPKGDVLQQKSPAEFFADNRTIAGFDNVCRGAWGLRGRLPAVLQRRHHARPPCAQQPLLLPLPPCAARQVPVHHHS